VSLHLCLLESVPASSEPAPIEPVPASGQPPPSVPIELAPAPIKPVPASGELPSVPIESVPASCESTSVPIEPVPVSGEPTSVLIELVPAPIELVPASGKPTPVPIEPVPSSGELPSVPIEPVSLPTPHPVLWEDWPRRRLRRRWLKLLRTETVRLTMGPVQMEMNTDGAEQSVLTRAQRAHWRLSWSERLARNARGAAAPPLEVTIHGLPPSFAHAFAIDIAA
jgi:hypothetical protein